MSLELVRALRFIALDKRGCVLARIGKVGSNWFIYSTDRSSFSQFDHKPFTDYQEAIAALQALPFIQEIRALEAEVRIWWRSKE